MIVRTSSAQWQGDLKQGKGDLELGSGVYKGPYTFKSRFGDGKETNPEELIAAAHAACFSMALAHGLSEAGHVPTSVKTSAKVHLEQQGAGFAITLIELVTEAAVPGLDNAAFQKAAEDTKQNCPISKALSATPMKLTAKLV
jgi:osmotically inducible protein OsmC